MRTPHCGNRNNPTRTDCLDLSEPRTFL
jgi:hypothetical protein